MTDQPLIENLTNRETEILNLLASGLSNRQIAERLFLSVKTIKWYNQQIYGKLGVSEVPDQQKRDEAIARARTLHLIEEDVDALPYNNLPAQTTEFIGRTSELADLGDLITNPKIRQITILAPGGMGKSRLALEVAARQLYDAADCFMHGVYFVSLASLQDADSIPLSIATATGFQFMSDDRDSEQQILDYLSNKHLLLILDNFEHLLDGAGIVSKILQAAPHVQTVVTSRERLNLSGEKVYSITGMVFPDWETPADALQFDAVKLFLQSAQLATTGFELRPEDLKFLARICRLVEGMPLAILLAAAWVEVLSLKEIADEIQNSIDFLTTNLRDVPDRHVSIRAVFEPTWNRLTDEERDVFMRFSVFRGGATREATQFVTGANLPTLQSLVNKSLITRITESHPAGRYEMHELLRQYAGDRLTKSGELEIARDTHSQYYLNALAEREADIKGRDQLGALDAIAADFENVKVAWYQAVEHTDYELVDRALECLGLFATFKGWMSEGVALFGRAREAFAPQSGEDPNPVWAKVLMRHHEDDLPPSSDRRPSMERCLEIARKTGDRFEIGFCLRQLAASFLYTDQTQALPFLDEAISHFQALGESFWISHIFLWCGLAHLYLGDKAQAVIYWEQSLAFSREIGDSLIVPTCLNNLGAVANSKGDVELAEQYFREALTVANERGVLVGKLGPLANLAGNAFSKGEFDLAAVYEEESRQVHSKVYGTLRKYLRGIDWGMAIITEYYPEARRILEADRPHPTDRPDQRMSWNLWSALAACGLEDYSEARQYLESVLKIAFMLEVPHSKIAAVLATAIIEANTGDPVRGSELLALVFRHSKALIGWVEKWPLVTRLSADLKDELGEETYNAAWERGKQLDLDETVHKILESDK